jgi:hypothetical protein
MAGKGVGTMVRKNGFFAVVWVSLLAVAFIGCAKKKTEGLEHFGTEVNFPTFEGPGDFLGHYSRVNGITMLKKLDGQPVDMSWIEPAFREKLCLTLTINNHCVA